MAQKMRSGALLGPPLAARARGRHTRWAAYPLIEIGGGPWMVLADCPAPRHNTGTAGLGRESSGRGKQRLGVKCVCPRALFLVKEYRRKERARRTERGRGDRPSPATAAAIRTALGVITSDAPAQRLHAPPADLSAGLCRSRAGMRIVDAAMRLKATTTDIGNHKRMCEPCPVRALCLAEALRLEIPDGIYGGATARERQVLLNKAVAA